MRLRAWLDEIEYVRRQQFREQQQAFLDEHPGLREYPGLPGRTCEQTVQEWVDGGGKPEPLYVQPAIETYVVTAGRDGDAMPVGGTPVIWNPVDGAMVLTPEMLAAAFDSLWEGGPVKPDWE